MDTPMAAHARRRLEELTDAAEEWCDALYYVNGRAYYCRLDKYHSEDDHSSPAEIRESEGRSLR